MHVILMGPQGAGKGTQALRVAPRLGLVHLSTGDLFRAAIAAGTPLGREVKGYLDRGDLVPDSVTIKMVDNRLEDIARGRAGDGEARGALFDGFPRTQAQAEALDAALAQRGERVSSVVVIDVPLEALIARLAGRRVCQRCGAVYHVEFNPPRHPGVCDRCGGELVQRDDDKPGPVKKRLDLYFRQTEPLLTYYRDRGLLATVNGNQPIDRVSEQLVRAIKRARLPES
jgi:adenylate kinase